MPSLHLPIFSKLLPVVLWTPSSSPLPLLCRKVVRLFSFVLAPWPSEIAVREAVAILLDERRPSSVTPPSHASSLARDWRTPATERVMYLPEPRRADALIQYEPE